MDIEYYQYNDTTQLSPHLNVQELKCKCGEPHNIIVNTDLVDKIEELLKYVAQYYNTNPDNVYIYISSGNRCSAHDLAVGGYGSGMHVSGKAVDFCISINNEYVDTKLISCIAKDIGFGGIGRIDDCYIHCDVGTKADHHGAYWFGDETVPCGTSGSVITEDQSYWDYYGITKTIEINNTITQEDNPQSTTTTTFIKKGIDISVYQSNIDWNTLSTDFCIIRAGYGRESYQVDKMFESHYNNCKQHNIPTGTYWYSYAVSEEEAIKEANVCLATIKGKQFEYPIFMDVEELRQFNLGKDTVSKIIKAFCSTVEKAGYFVGLYMSSSHLNTYVTEDIKNNYTIWVADYTGNKPIYTGNYGMWQYSGHGHIQGITGEVDLDYCYTDYPSIIKSNGLNGFNTDSYTPPTTDMKKIKIEIDGKVYEGEVKDVSNN